MSLASYRGYVYISLPEDNEFYDVNSIGKSESFQKNANTRCVPKKDRPNITWLNKASSNVARPKRSEYRGAWPEKGRQLEVRSKRRRQTNAGPKRETNQCVVKKRQINRFSTKK